MYQALEEAVVNALYHRDYLSYQSIMIEIEPELIRIISFPGIDRSIPQREIEEGERFSSRYYRNKRLGEFLKELDLSEGKSTGIPTIQEELRNNGSPRAGFFTDEDRRAVSVEIPIHPDFINKKVDIENEKVDIGPKKVDIQGLKVNYIKRIKAIGANKSTLQKIDALLNVVELEQTFGRTEVVNALNISPTAASKFIGKMCQAGVLEAVEGKGKGKYRLNCR